MLFNKMSLNYENFLLDSCFFKPTPQTHWVKKAETNSATVFQHLYRTIAFHFNNINKREAKELAILKRSTTKDSSYLKIFKSCRKRITADLTINYIGVRRVMKTKLMHPGHILFQDIESQTSTTIENINKMDGISTEQDILGARVMMQKAIDQK